MSMVENLLPELKAFDATARFGGMSAAARALGLRQPTISAHIARLEKHYGVELFHRRGRQVQLTDFGKPGPMPPNLSPGISRQN